MFYYLLSTIMLHRCVHHPTKQAKNPANVFSCVSVPITNTTRFGTLRDWCMNPHTLT